MADILRARRLRRGLPRPRLPRTPLPAELFLRRKWLPGQPLPTQERWLTPYRGELALATHGRRTAGGDRAGCSACWSRVRHSLGAHRRRRRRSATARRRSRPARCHGRTAPCVPRRSPWSWPPRHSSRAGHVGPGPAAGARPSRCRCARRAAVDHPAPPRSDPRPRPAAGHPEEKPCPRLPSPRAPARRPTAAAACSSPTSSSRSCPASGRATSCTPPRAATSSSSSTTPVAATSTSSTRGDAAAAVGHAHGRAGPHPRRDPRRRLVQAGGGRGDRGRHRRPAHRLGHGARGLARRVGQHDRRARDPPADPHDASSRSGATTRPIDRPGADRAAARPGDRLVVVGRQEDLAGFLRHVVGSSAMGEQLFALGGALLAAGVLARSGRRIGLPTIPLFMVAGDPASAPTRRARLRASTPRTSSCSPRSASSCCCSTSASSSRLGDLVSGGRQLLGVGAIYLAAQRRRRLPVRPRPRLGHQPRRWSSPARSASRRRPSSRSC